MGVPRETADGERRVALVPEVIRKLTAKDFEVVVESGAGSAAMLSDEAYEEAGASIGEDVWSADVVAKVAPPSAEEIGKLGNDTILVGFLGPLSNPETTQALASAGATSFAMEAIPRISRAQSMDALSSQSNVAGYKSVLLATVHLGRFLPMMMTAAGTVPPAKVLVLGAGVAGLQAIATARRLGAVVSATDVRPAAKEQVESLGATFVWLESDEAKQAETKGGYAKEMSEDYKRRQAALVADTLKKQDIVICTAAIPGRQAPRLVSAEMVRSMRPGSVIVDLAVETGGNCELSESGRVIDINGVKVVGHRNVPGRLPIDASALYARNLVSFVTLLVDAKTKALQLETSDEIVKASMLTRGGAVVHPSFAAAAVAAPAGKP
ncbi:MAG: Re/Si-specific NAD(P)(+) transhydrogenase subunit alpha [Planctomycetes bacterium]|nr:Re/Si-specific NAD(P)(+) transhydrogenase subunit alpha [Planctomycetota bacterium]